jgi:hypothetical protein
MHMSVKLYKKKLCTVADRWLCFLKFFYMELANMPGKNRGWGVQVIALTLL